VAVASNFEFLPEEAGAHVGRRGGVAHPHVAWLYVTEARPIGFGLHRWRRTRNLLVSFQARPQARSLG